MNIKIPLKHRVAAKPYLVSWSMASITLCGWFLCLIYSITSNWSFFFGFPIILTVGAVLLLLVGLAFFGQIVFIPMVFPLLSRLNSCDYSAGAQVVVLRGKHLGKTVTVSEIAQGQGGSKHEVVIISEDDISVYKERFFVPYELGDPNIVQKIQQQKSAVLSRSAK